MMALLYSKHLSFSDAYFEITFPSFLIFSAPISLKFFKKCGSFKMQKWECSLRNYVKYQPIKNGVG